MGYDDGVDMRRFINFWIETFVRAADANSCGDDTAYRCLAAAETQSLTRADLEKEVGDLEISYTGQS